MELASLAIIHLSPHHVALVPVECHGASLSHGVEVRCVGACACVCVCGQQI